MFGWLFGRKSHYGAQFAHHTARDDWDVMLRDLYFQVIDGWAPVGLGVITNSRNGEVPLAKPHVQLARHLPPELEPSMRSLGAAQFEEIFNRAGGLRPDETDCFKVRNLGLPNNALVYLIEHKDKRRRALLVFGGKRIKGETEQHLANASRIVSAKGGVSAASAGAAAQSPTAPEGGFGSVTAVRQAETGQLVAREEELVAQKDALAYAQRVELGRIEEELKKRQTKR